MGRVTKKTIRKTTHQYIFLSTFLVNRYHNESQLSFGDNTQQIEDEEKKREEERRKKEEEINSKLPTYDPRQGGKTNIHFGDEKPDYRRKDEVTTSVRVHNPPGGRSNIQFGWTVYEWLFQYCLYLLNFLVEIRNEDL